MRQAFLILVDRTPCPVLATIMFPLCNHF